MTWFAQRKVAPTHESPAPAGFCFPARQRWASRNGVWQPFWQPIRSHGLRGAGSTWPGYPDAATKEAPRELVIRRRRETTESAPPCLHLTLLRPGRHRPHIDITYTTTDRFVSPAGHRDPVGFANWAVEFGSCGPRRCLAYRRPAGTRLEVIAVRRVR